MQEAGTGALGLLKFPWQLSPGHYVLAPRAPPRGGPGGRGERSRRPPPPALAPQEHASRCDPSGGPRRGPASEGAGPLRAALTGVCAPPLSAGWEGARAGLVRVSVALGASKAGEAGACDRGLWWPSF